MLPGFFIHARKVFVARGGNLKKLNYVGQEAGSVRKRGIPLPHRARFLRGGGQLDFYELERQIVPGLRENFQGI